MLVVGLGNPDKTYECTRHNTGFIFIDFLKAKLRINEESLCCRSLVMLKHYAGEKVILAKPLTYMNCSGDAVKLLVNKYKVNLSELLIVYDDVDLPLGTIKLKPRGGAGTHNGMKSIIEKLESTNFPRLRIGIASAKKITNLTDFVLAEFTKQEYNILKKVMEACIEAIFIFIKKDINAAMNYINNFYCEE